MINYIHNRKISIKRIKNPIKRTIEDIRFKITIYKFKKEFKTYNFLDNIMIYEMISYFLSNNIDYIDLKCKVVENEIITSMIINFDDIYILFKIYHNDNKTTVEYYNALYKESYNFHTSSLAFKKEAKRVNNILYEIMKEIILRKEGIRL